jgi:hypothetical protein
MKGDNNMEVFLNLLHYFVYKFMTKFYLFYMKIDPLLNIVYKTEYAKKHFEKKGYDPTAVLMDTFNDPHYGFSSWYSYIFLNCAFMPPSILLLTLFTKIFEYSGSSPLPYIMLIIGWGTIIGVVSDIYLLRRDKYVKYIRLFNKQPRKWKTKWAFVSAGVLLLPLIITIIGMNLLP